jgi:hypothetical protein
LSAAQEPVPSTEADLFFEDDDVDDHAGSNGNGTASGSAGRAARPVRSAGPRRIDELQDHDERDDFAPRADGGSVATIDAPPTELVAPPAFVVDDGVDVGADEADQDEQDDGSAASGRLKARKVRRVVRYVSPWSVLKVSLLFYACLWVILTIASVLLWRAAVATGAIDNAEKFLARAFGESQFTIDGREIFRASTLAGLILVFAGTGFTVMMSLLFNVICDITGGIRFTVLELESVKRLRKPRPNE